VRRQLQLACAIAAAILCGSGASAQSVSQRAYTKADLSGWVGTPDTLPLLIHRIEATTAGRVLEIRFINSDGEVGFRAAVAKSGSVTFLKVAAEGGATIELSEASVPDWMLKWKARADLGAAKSATVPLPQAIRAAEQANGGASAVAAGIASSASNPTSDVKAYNVLVYRDGEVHRVAVDDQSGQVISNPGALADWP
jgi:uncharacterized membrane protein YkoI